VEHEQEMEGKKCGYRTLGQKSEAASREGLWASRTNNRVRKRNRESKCDENFEKGSEKKEREGKAF